MSIYTDILKFVYRDAWGLAIPIVGLPSIAGIIILSFCVRNWISREKFPKSSFMPLIVWMGGVLFYCLYVVFGIIIGLLYKAPLPSVLEMIRRFFIYFFLLSFLWFLLPEYFGFIITKFVQKRFHLSCKAIKLQLAILPLAVTVPLIILYWNLGARASLLFGVSID